MKKYKTHLIILAALYLLSFVPLIMAAGNSNTFTEKDDLKKEGPVLEACGKDSEKGCKKNTKKKFQVNKIPADKPEDQK